MRQAKNAPLDKVVEATVGVIDQLLANRPIGLSQPDYTGDMWDGITGYRGVRVFFYTNRGTPVIPHLQVNGPDSVVEAVIDHYAPRGIRPMRAARGPGHVVLNVPD